MSMSWIDTRGSDFEEDWQQVNPRVVVCAPPEDLPFWKARLESLGVSRVDLHHTHRDALNEIQNYFDSYTDPKCSEPPNGVYWEIVMLFDDKIEKAPDLSKKDEQLFHGTCDCDDYDDCDDCDHLGYSRGWASVTGVGAFTDVKVTYKSSDEMLVDLLTDALNGTADPWYGVGHVYKPNRHVRKGNL